MTRDRRTREQKLADELCYHLWRAAADTEEHQEGREAKSVRGNKVFFVCEVLK